MLRAHLVSALPMHFGMEKIWFQELILPDIPDGSTSSRHCPAVFHPVVGGPNSGTCSMRREFLCTNIAYVVVLCACLSDVKLDYVQILSMKNSLRT